MRDRTSLNSQGEFQEQTTTWPNFPLDGSATEATDDWVPGVGSRLPRVDGVKRADGFGFAVCEERGVRLMVVRADEKEL